VVRIPVKGAALFCEKKMSVESTAEVVFGGLKSRFEQGLVEWERRVGRGYESQPYFTWTGKFPTVQEGGTRAKI